MTMENKLRAAAAAGRPGCVTIESLYTAASRWDLVNQVPFMRVTCVTTGEDGTCETPFGRIDYVHVDIPGEELLRRSIDDGSPLRLADRELTLETLRLTGLDRIYDLIDENGDDLF